VSTDRLAPALRDLLAAGEPAILVVVARAAGSTPREGGARMLVTGREILGTVGGGRLEWEAVGRGRAMLDTGEAEAGLELPLGPAVGQCCGGHVTLALRRADAGLLARLEVQEAEEASALPPVLLFGAGHVGKALASALAPLPLRVRWIDGRAEQFPDRLPESVEVLVTERLVAEVEAAPAGAAFLVLTHSHALDFALCEAVLRRGDFAYLGLIGSATKRARFERGFRELGLLGATLARLTCPIGGDTLRDKRPAVIAALTAAEVLLALGGRAAVGVATP
jgi:xanthine dehydrogenase accessory protein XdhC